MTDRPGRTAEAPRSSGPPTGSVRRIRLPQKLRNMELWLLIVACLINASALVLVQLGAMGRIDTQLLLLGAGLSALVFGVHIAMPSPLSTVAMAATIAIALHTIWRTEALSQPLSPSAMSMR